MSATLDVGVWFGCVAKPGTTAAKVLRARAREAEGLPVDVGLGVCIDRTGETNAGERHQWMVLRSRASMVNGPTINEDVGAPTLIEWSEQRLGWSRAIVEMVANLGLRIEELGPIGTHLAGVRG